ncbi:hemagglutinin repeat-containing protein [Noviherbaspirillum sp. 1P10PC]|uniref:two-partner secretion domain-containing protein n=1 Tax=Noviherbaspirillum sp. 1P10PC TaxID=3132292 RepID=UPI0039A23513
MNKLAFRVIFNRHRDLLMAVAETARACGGGMVSAGRVCRHPVPSCNKRLLYRVSTMLASLYLAFPPALAQIVADPNAAAGRRPLVEASANGLPLVRIARPSAAGVSHNQYSQFNIDGRGMLLNNAITITQTRQAGFIDGNPNLSGGSARVILNEVTGVAPSQLLGYAEVAGSKAEVVIANPNGISCDGCGFINTSRAVLSTGTPVIGAAGGLDSLRVVRGQVRIGANGLNAAELDQLDLIARSVEINGSLWGRQLSVIAGANQVAYAGLEASAIEGQGGRPTVAIDLARLGGMFGDKIRLIGTEAGVGVNTEGVINARAGDLVIDSQGRLRFAGAVSAAGAIRANSAGMLENSGTVYGTQKVVIGSGESLINSGTIAGGDDLTIRAASVDASGMLAAGVHADGSMAASGSLSVQATGQIHAGGRNQAAGDITFTAGRLDLAGARSEARGMLTLTAQAGDIVLDDAQTLAGTRIGIEALQGTVFNNASGSGAARIEAAHIGIDAQALSNRGGLISQTGNEAGSKVHVSGELDNSAGTIVGNAQDLSIASATLLNDGGAIRHAGSGTLLIRAGALKNRNGGSIGSNGTLDLAASSLDNKGGAITSALDATLTITDDAGNQGGKLSTGANLTMRAAQLDNSGGQLHALGKQLDLTIDGLLTNAGGPSGSIGSNGNAIIRAGALRNSGMMHATGDLQALVANVLDNSGGQLRAGGLLHAQAGAGWWNAGGIASGNQLQLTAASIHNRKGSISQSGSGTAIIDARSGLLDNSEGLIEANADRLTLSAGALHNDAGAIRHAGTGLLKIDSGDFVNAGGTVATNGQADIHATDAGNAGTISAARSLSVAATSLRNNDGILISGGDLTVKAGALLVNAGGSLQAGDAASPARIQVSAGRIDNRDGQISAASLDLAAGTLQNNGGLILQSDAAGHAVVDVHTELDNRNGDIAVAAHELRLTPGRQFRNDGGAVLHTGGGLLTLGAAAMSNEAGALRTNGGLVLQAATTSNRAGKISAVGNLDISSSGGIDNSLLGSQGGTISGGQVMLTTAAGKLDNAGGTIESASSLTVRARELSNDSGLIVNRGTEALTVDAKGTASNQGGSIVGLGQLKLDAAGIDNRAGVISAQGDATITSSVQISNAGGVMQSWSKLAARATTVLDNANGKLRALGQGSALEASGAQLINSGGLIINAGKGLAAVTAGSIVNANPEGAQDAGLIGGNGDLLVSAGTLQNLTQASLVAGGDMTLAVTGLTDNGGKLIAGRKLLMRQPGASLRNNGGEISAADINLTTASLDNSSGVIANPKGSDGNVAIHTGQLVNGGGRIGSDRDLLVVADRLTGKGNLVGGRDADVRLQGDYTNEAGNLISANRELRLSTTGTLTNAGTLGAADSIVLDAARLVNLNNAVIASGSPDDPATGLTRLNIAGDVDNAGRIEGNRVDSRSSNFHNRGTVLGDLVSVRADSLDNDGQAGMIAAVSNLDLWIRRTLSNRRGATLFSLGDINMAADEARDGAGLLLHRIGVVNNLSSTVEAGGQLNLAAELVNNVRENVRTENVTVADAAFTLTMLPWLSSLAPGRGTPERNTNTNRFDAYYLDPKAILSDEAMLTPDGYVIHKATVKLNANDSAFQWMVGGLTYPLEDGQSDVQYGSTSRLPPESGTRIIYYINRRNNEANPDQVAGVDPWADRANYLIRQMLGSASYSGNFGNCTSNCVRLEALPDFTDPTTQIMANHRIAREGIAAPGVFPVEVQRKAHQTITETRLSADSGQVASMTSGGAMQLQIGTLLSNDNGQIAAGGNLLVNGQAVSDSSSQALIRNIGTRLERTYTFENQSGFGSAMIEAAPPVDWVSWSNSSITQPIATVGGTITSNQTVVINAGKLVNQTVTKVNGPGGASPLAIGLGEDIAVYTGSAADRQLKPAIQGMPGIMQAVAAAAGTLAAPLPGVARMVDGARAGALSQTLPTSGLYRIEPQPQGRYLVETDPRFTSYKNFISSDYLLQRLGIQPERTQKRLGDGFYEQRPVLAQATAMTGKRFLDGHASAEAQYIDLMTNGVAFAERFALTPGIALTDQQMAQLTSNIVWLVEQSVTLPDGSRQTVLAPQVYLARHAQLTPTGALVAGDALGIQASEVDNRGSTLQATNALVLRTTGDVDNSAGAILGGNVSLQVGNNLLARSLTGTERSTTGKQSSSTTSVTAVSRIAATGDLSMSAGGDLTMQGAQVSAAGDLTMKAGRKLSVSGVETGSEYDLSTGDGWAGMKGLPSIFDSMRRESTYQSSTRTSVGSSITAGGNLNVFSAGAVNIEGSQLSAGADLAIAAQGPVNIVNSTGRSTLNMSARTSSYRSSTDLTTDTVIGSKLAAGGQVSVHAGVEQGADGSLRFNPSAGKEGSDLTLRGSSIVAGLNPALDGKVSLGATGRTELDAARSNFSYRTESSQTSSSTLSSTYRRDLDSRKAQTATGSTVSGSAVSVTSGGDLTVRGSAIAGSGTVSLSAGGNVVVEAARESRQEYHLHEEKKSGVFASGSGIGITIGSRSERDEYQGDGLTENRRRSLVGSSTGDVVVQAQGNVTIAGSDLVSGQDTILVGRNVTLNPGTDRHDSRETHDVKQSGLSITVSGPAAAVAQSVARAADRDVQSRDPRIAALQGVKAGLMVNDYLDKAGQAKALDAANAANGDPNAAPASKPMAFKISATVGSSKSHAQSVSRETVQSGSSIAAGKDVYISATGNGERDAAGYAVDGDLKAAGARISGNNITIAAARDVELTAAESTASNRGQSSGSSVGVGVGFAVGGKQNGVTLEAQASASRGKADQDSSRYDASQIRAADTLRIESGRDTTLHGAQASGNRVETQIGRNLDITSTQDKETVRIEQQSASAGISVCVPPACVGTPVQGSVSYQRADVDSGYLSVREQSGLYAGKEGYEVQVKGNTNLTGAVIASSAEAAKNRLVTGTLTTSDLENRAEYSASISGISLSTGDKNTVVVTPNVGMPSGDSAAGVTRSAISPGTIVITDDASQQARTGQDAATTVATLNRDTANANGAIGKIFDQKKVQQQQELSRLVGEVGNQAVGTVSQKLGLADGSPEKMALHAAVGALQASAAGGNALAGAAGAAAGEYVLTQVSDYLERHPELTPGQRNVIQQWAAVVTGGAVGAVVGGGGAAQAGAASALDGERYNRQLHPTEVKWIQNKSAEFAKKLYSTDTPSKEQIAQAQSYLTYAALGNDDNAEQKANVVLGIGKDESYIAAKQFLNNQPDVFINDQGKAQRVFTVQGNEFYEPLKYSQYNADATYRDFMWNSVGINYAPPASASAQDKALYEQRETERLARDAKNLVTGMIPGVMAIGAGTVLNRSSAVKLPGSGEAGNQVPKPENVKATAGGNSAGSTYQSILGRIPGKVIYEADALTPGALGNDPSGLPGTFSGGRYATVQLDKPMTVYRAWAPGQSREFGAFWSLEEPVGSLQTSIDADLLPQWGNVRGTPFSAQATQYTTITLPAGTTIYVGEVGSQGSVWVGGKSQLLIEGGVQPSWKTGGGTLK